MINWFKSRRVRIRPGRVTPEAAPRWGPGSPCPRPRGGDSGQPSLGMTLASRARMDGSAPSCTAGEGPVSVGRLCRTLTYFGLWLVSTSCGRVEFGEDRIEIDAGLVDLPMPMDLGPEVDLGEPDVGPAPDLGCTPIVLPDGFPQAWPFEATEAGYRDVFWDWAVPEAGCSGPNGSPNCHGGGESPFIPFEAQLGADYQAAIDALWPLIVEAPPLDLEAPEGRLWRHLPNHPDHVGPSYFGPVPARLDALIQQAKDCNVASFLVAPPDAGIECTGGPSEGADAGDDGGDLASGDSGRDVSSGETPLCYCPTPDAGPLMTTFCAF